MTFPTVAGLVGSTEESNTSSHTMSLPGSIASGDLLIAFFGTDGNSAITFPNEGIDWIQLHETQGGGSPTFGVWYRIADGGEGATITVASAASERSAHQCYRITGYANTPENGTPATGSSANPDPPSLTPTWGAKDTLWLAGCCYDGNGTISAYPIDFTDGRNDSNASSFGCGVGSARLELNDTSKNPDNFTQTGNQQWVATTIAVKPAAAPSGWAGGDVNGVALAAIKKINSVAIANIKKVNGIA